MFQVFLLQRRNHNTNTLQKENSWNPDKARLAGGEHLPFLLLVTVSHPRLI